MVLTTTEITGSCGTTKSLIDQKFSLKYIPSVNSINAGTSSSGSPGYVKGQNLRIGTITTVNGQNAVQINSIPFQLTGITSTGNCLF